MIVTKWSPNLKPAEDSPIVPVWITIPNLPIHLHDQKALFSITSALGKPLKVDHATLNFSRPHAARVCIELDVSKTLHQRIHIKHVEEDLFFQVIYEDPPPFCSSCLKLGHHLSSCKPEKLPAKLPDSLPGKDKKDEHDWTTVQRKGKSQQVQSKEKWVPKPTSSQPYRGKNFAFMLGYNGFYSVANNKIWFLWDQSNFSLVDMSDFAQIVHFTLQDKHNNSFSIISTVYGSHSAKERTALWDNIASFNNLNHHPWCLGGDFNCISDSLHHKGARLPDLGAISDFSNCITNCNLQECSFTGPHFTWHGSRSNGNVWRRLDRVFYNAEWGEHWESISMHHLAKGGSDHCPILFSSKQGCGQGPKSFRFQNMWLLRKDFLQVCKDTWEEMPYFGGMRCLFSKLQHLKGKLSSWNKEHFGNIFDLLKEAEAEAIKGEKLFEDNPTTENRSILNQKRAILADLSNREFIFWKQKCNLKWLQEGDANTKFFHNLAKAKRSQQRISLFKDDRAKCPKNFRVADEWLENKGLLPRFLNHPKPRMVKWLAPPKGRLKINIDASFNMTSSRGAAIIRNEEGSFVRAASFQVSAQTPYQAELAASIKGLTWALQFHAHLIYETDAKEITLRLNRYVHHRSSPFPIDTLGSLIHDNNIWILPKITLISSDLPFPQVLNYEFVNRPIFIAFIRQVPANGEGNLPFT
ncbi:unnamed protein product [Cuscuta campestris]|uniref:DUF4283 domain-containing protein n=1 Tax=Cuscuta campestris TaxID=132261 RepID=A0A484MN47_9ASTE|nr:unnamed protein product [Cuscuta campestris]